MSPEDQYPLTDLFIALPKLDILEAIEAKKPPAAACFGSVGAISEFLNFNQQINTNPIEKREFLLLQKSI